MLLEDLEMGVERQEGNRSLTHFYFKKDTVLLNWLATGQKHDGVKNLATTKV